MKVFPSIYFYKHFQFGKCRKADKGAKRKDERREMDSVGE